MNEMIFDNKASGLDRLLRPRSVAIIGASAKPGSLGASVLSNLERYGYGGAIHLVNPTRATIGDRPCLPSVDALPEGVDVAVLAIPRPAVLESIRALAVRGVGSAIIFSAGFAEGGDEGKTEQAEIARIARESGMIVEGPNCLGLANFRDHVPLTFVELPEARAEGSRRLAVVSQSGAMAAVLATTMISRHVPLSAFVSTGNEAAAGVEEFVEHFLAEPDTQVIGMIVEHFRDPPRFLAAARAARRAGKHIVLLHPGKSEAGRASAATHTGAMAGDFAVMKVHVERAGVMVAETLEELGDLCEILVRVPKPPHGALAVLAESGAFKALTLDFCESLGIDLPNFTDDNSPELRAEMPSFVPVSNPLDITAQGLVDATLYTRTLSALACDRRVDTIVVTLIQTIENTASIKLRAVAEAVEALDGAKPVMIAGLDEGAGVNADEIATLRALGVPYFPTTERLFRAFRTLAEYGRRDFSAAPARVVEVGDLPAMPVIPEYRAKLLLGPLGISFPAAHMATTLEEARDAARRLGYPVVLKAQSPDLSHKSDAGGVIVGLNDETALVEGWERLHANIAQHRPGLALDGVLVEAMGERGTELIVGARNDPEWGPVILVGFGGVMAELLHDVRLLPPDLPRETIIAELGKLRMGKLLTGFRGSQPLDLGAVADTVSALGALLLAKPEIREIDLNPLVVYPRGAVALDALISL